MSYQQDSIDWQVIEQVDLWLDGAVSEHYKRQPLAQDWARISKVGEELGEAISAFIGLSGQNPRKGIYASYDDLANELADTALTAIFALQHFTKNTSTVKHILLSKQQAIYERMVKANGAESSS